MRKKARWIILIGLVIGIKLFSLFPEAVENWYSAGIYPAISQTQRILLGWIPFSVGDLLYAAVIIYLGYKLFRFLKKLFRKEVNKNYLWYATRWLVYKAGWVYVLFNGLWGLNYNRLGIAEQLGLKKERYTKEDLGDVMTELAFKLNSLDSAAHLNRLPLRVKNNVFDGAVIAYENLWDRNALFSYSFRSVKPSMYSYLGNYLGFTGYYNPFSGEAQVNTTVPVYIQPFTTCHEIGHQLGYAKESEANFAGYLSARASDNPAFRYSVYFDLYAYGHGYLYRQDSVLAKHLDSSLHTSVRKDYRTLRDFIDQHENPFEVVIDKLYGRYLEANEQPAGKMSYNEVVGWLIAYYKKYGKEAI